MKNTTLHQAAQDYMELLENIDLETGELPSEFGDLKTALNTKAASVAAWILDNDAHADMVEQQAKRLLERVKAANKRSEWARFYLRTHMKFTGLTSIKSEDGTFGVKLELDRDESIEIQDVELIPPQFCKEETVKKVDKLSLKEAIKGGLVVLGATLVKKDRLTIK